MKQASSSRKREREFQQSRQDGVPVRDDPSSPTETAHKPDKTKRKHYLRQYRRWLWPYRWGLITILLLALLTTGLDMVWPLAIRLIMDGALTGPAAKPDRIHSLLHLGLLIIAVLLLKQTVEVI